MSAGAPTVIAKLATNTGSAANFAPDDAIDLTGLGYVASDTVLLTSGNLLEVETSAGAVVASVQLDAATNYGGYIFALQSDGAGGTEIVNPVFSDNFSQYAPTSANSSNGKGYNWTPGANWTVTAGSVDLCGPNTNQNYNLGVDPLSGVSTNDYVDLDGSTNTAGALTTIASFAAGTYTLHFDLAGDQRASSSPSQTTVISLGDWSTTITLAGAAALKEYTYTFTTTSAGNLSFAETSQSAGGNNAGNLLESVQLLAVACFLRGTRLRTDKGETPVEALNVGDLVITASGEARPIRWLGRRRIEIARFPGEASQILPICVTKGAFGDQLPLRDLWLSPEHCLAFDGALIPVKILLNGKSVAQHERAQVEYWHVELDSHDVIFAEGLPAETYLDTGNRAGFEDGAVVAAFPDFAPKHWTETCLPMAFGGAPVARAKTALIERLADLGVPRTQDPDLHLTADGQRIAPMPLGGDRFAFFVPAGRRRLALVSKTFVPAHVEADSDDVRTLGLAVGGLEIDAEAVALDSPALGEGWLAPEGELRWTDGCASLPAGARMVVVRLAQRPHYWGAPQLARVRLFA